MHLLAPNYELNVTLRPDESDLEGVLFPAKLNRKIILVRLLAVMTAFINAAQ